jgi:hypothetical protein
MWLMTTQGFYSVVALREQRDRLLVRARTREDIEALRTQIPAIDVFDDPGADYRWRAEVTRADWRDALAQLVDDVDYDKFKNAVAKDQGEQRALLYGQVWATLLELQRD